METTSSCNLCDSKAIGVARKQNGFYHCEDCNHYFDNPRPTLEEISAHYSQKGQYDEWLSELPARESLWKRRLAKILKHKRSGKLLDGGAGIGQFLSLARRYFEIYGTEISSIAVGHAKERYGIDLKQGSLENMTWSHRFDVVTLFHVLEHVHSPGMTLQTCRQLLNPGGILVIAVPNDVDAILSRRSRILRRGGFQKYNSLGELGIPKLGPKIAEWHLSHFTETSLRMGIERAGFTILESSLDPHFAVSGLSRSLRRNARYQFYRLVHSITGLNLYDTLWVVAQKS